jgi:ATP-binding cassette subfamily F protein 3
VGESEKQISDLEAAIHLIEDRMSTPEGAEDVTLVNKHGKLSQQLDTAMQEWENWSQQLEGLQKEA